MLISSPQMPAIPSSVLGPAQPDPGSPVSTAFGNLAPSVLPDARAFSSVSAPTARGT